MSAGEIALRFMAAWLAVGAGLFIASESLRALRFATVTAVDAAPRRGRRYARALHVVPFALALGLLAVGLNGVVRVVPW